MTEDANDLARELGVDGLRAVFDASKPSRSSNKTNAKTDDTSVVNPVIKTSAAPKTNIEIRWHGDRPPEPPQWLVKGLIPQMGVGLLSGQWGTGKTFVGLDLCGAVMTTSSFAGHPVVRHGGVLFIAAEGGSHIPIRLAGLVEGRLKEAAPDSSIDAEQPVPLPFGWIEECPALTEKGSVEILVAIAEAAAAKMKTVHKLPLVLVIVDTMAAAACFADEDDAAQGQRAMNALAELSRRTGAFVLAIDHFGKLTETGTRGSSAKEGAADLVLALLAERKTNGDTSGHRMAVRKSRGGVAGCEKLYSLSVVDLGQDKDGDRVTTCVVSWEVEPAERSTPKARWPKSLKIFQAALTTVLQAHGTTVRPFGADGPTVRAVSGAVARAEFSSAYPADGEDEAKKKEAKRKAFNRSLRQAIDKGLVVSREIGGVDHLWFSNKSEEADIR